MAFTQSQLDALEAAIASGTLEVRTGDKSVRYHSLDEMIKLREVIRNQLNADAQTPTSRASRSPQRSSCATPRPSPLPRTAAGVTGTSPRLGSGLSRGLTGSLDNGFDHGRSMTYSVDQSIAGRCQR